MVFGAGAGVVAGVGAGVGCGVGFGAGPGVGAGVGAGASGAAQPKPTISRPKTTITLTAIHIPFFFINLISFTDFYRFLTVPSDSVTW